MFIMQSCALELNVLAQLLEGLLEALMHVLFQPLSV